MSNEFSNWNMQYKKPRLNKGRHPPGLTGKEIGFFYRNRHMKNKLEGKTNKFSITFAMPPYVETAVKKNLKSILKSAEIQNIILPQFKKNYLLNKETETTDGNPPVFSQLEESTVGTSKNSSNETSQQSYLRPCSTFKYGYQDIISGTFDEKLEECLAKEINITKISPQDTQLSATFYNEYIEMKQNSQYKKMLEFRKILPTYSMSQDILNAISKNQVLVISGETGCGKSTQVPQIILDDAICNKRGANVKVLVTQPRRIAASALAGRVAKERAENLGKTVGYAVRLERVMERQRGSIQYCTTGILLTELEVNQSLSNYSHVILDEVHERDSNIDLAMCMLKQILKKRNNLKLILMSATIDAESLSEYFDNCCIMHIEGLAYPVKDVYLEEILAITKFRFPEHKGQSKSYNKPTRIRGKFQDGSGSRDNRKLQEHLDEVGDWIKSKRNDLDVNVIKQLKNPLSEELNFDLVVQLIVHISKGEPGAILVFVPGFTDISKLIGILKDSNIRPPRYEIYPLHSKLPTFEQHKIFEKPPNHIRKIIIATNIAETSITVDDIVYVIDGARHKITGLNVEQNIETLNVEYISKANLRQRRGRAGRCQPGVCYHLLTSFRAERLAERTPPELQRSNLLEAVLMIKRLRLGHAAQALRSVPSPPADSSVHWAVKHLQRCDALNAEEKLTPLGWHMARLPVHPAAGKLVLLGALFGCLDRAASVAAVWGFKDPFLLIVDHINWCWGVLNRAWLGVGVSGALQEPFDPMNLNPFDHLILPYEKEIEERRRELTLGEPSDHIAVSEAIIGFEQCPRHDRRNYCYDNYLSYNTCELLSDMKNQLGGNLKAMGFLASGSVKSEWENRNANNFSLFKAIVAAALYPNIGTVRWIGTHSRKPFPTIRIVARTPEDGRVSLHPSSVMAAGGRGRGLNWTRPGANWIVYWMKRRSAELYILDVTLVYSLPLLFFGDFILTKDPETKDDYFLDVSSIKVRVKKETADLLHDLRVVLNHVLASKVMSSTSDSIRTSNFEEQILNTIMELITAEDEQADYVVLNEDLTESDYSEND